MAESPLVIALHSLDAILETGLRMRPPEKSGTVTAFAVEQSVLCSPVCREITAKYGHFSCIPEGRIADFLCSPDCVAEGVRFEPSVRFCRAKPRHLRKLQIAKPYQRISPYNPTSELCNQSGFDSPSIRPERRTPSDSLDRIGYFAKPQTASWEVPCDCVPSRQSENRKVSPVKRTA
jgi:hypothetical protein